MATRHMLFRTSGGFMKKSMACLSVLLLLTSGALAANDAKEVERVKEAGEVLKEILNVPDDIPQDLLDKAECVIVLPSVMKAAFVVGGSYGRGVLTCRSGPAFNGR